MKPFVVIVTFGGKTWARAKLRDGQNRAIIALEELISFVAVVGLSASGGSHSCV
jgi:nitric oxide reductase large subunit